MKKLIGDRKFYLTVFSIIIPIMIQQGIQTAVSLIDNVMVNMLGDFAYRGVSVVNQIIFILQISLVGGLAGPGIFVSQYFGAKQDENLREAFKIKIFFMIIICIVSILIILLIGDNILISFLTDKNGYFDENSFIEAKKYIKVILFCIPLNGLSVLFSSTFREIGQVKTPMYAGIIAILINIFFNYALMFGNFGFPNMGVAGAALGTIIARIIEVIILLVVAIKNRMVFIDGLFNGKLIKFSLFKNISKKTIPMVCNELLWALGTTAFVFLYAKKGTDVMQAYNISNTTANLFYTIFAAMSIGIQILVGKKLGENNIEEAKENAGKLILLGTMISFVSGIILISIAPFVSRLYNTTDEITNLSIQFMRIVGVMIFIYSFNGSCFFTIRAGGKTFITFLFDSAYMWAVAVPLAFILIYFTNLDILLIYALIQIPDLIKALIGFFLVKSGFWASNLTLNNDKEIIYE